LKVALQQVQAQLQKLAGDEEALRQKRQTCQELQTKVNYLETTRAQLERDVAEIEDKLKLLMSQGDARCPLCERELGTEHRALIEQKYTGDRDGKSAAAKSHQAEMVIKKAELKSLENEISWTETKLNQEKAKVQGSASVLHQQISEAEQAGTRLLEERKGLAEIEERLNTRSYALNEQQTLSLIEEELTKLHYDAPEHEQVRQRLAELEPLEPAKRQLEEADRLIHQEKEFIARAEQAGQELRLSLAADEQQRQALSTEVSRLPQVVASFAQAEAEHQTLVTQQRQVEEAVWGVRSQLRHCEELEAKKKEKEQLRLQAVQEEQIYKELAQAFGKEGIQAMLIEIAIPEIEIEANKLLGRMTDNRMHVKMETQRETKKGTVAETLDIYIADELGTRNYEMFSGGETFRINFAIRIALSKLLARRTGAPLRTLIIDEGFGTQDSTGIEKLKEAINSIQDDFDKILVITHIDELKDAFPARIDVIKTADGSTIEVS
jgi:exonuclease SbcC